MIFILLVIFAFCAGLIDAAVGGGGLIHVPGLFSALPLEAPARLFGTNKVASVFGTAFAARSFVGKVTIPWALVLPAAASAFCMSFCGAAVASAIPKDVMRILVLMLVIMMAVYTLLRKDFGSVSKAREVGARERVLSTLLGGGIGFYDGVFGPGTGSFLIFLFIRFFAFDFLQASASSKFVNMATNLAALTYFVPTGNVLWGFAIPMAGANVCGALCGSWLAITRGAGFIRVLFCVCLGC